MASYDDTATVSGSVVSFPNGADDVPLKSCEVALSASLDGYSSVDVVQTGKNLLPSLVDGVYEGNGVKAVVVGGVATLSGTATSSGNAFSIPLTHEFVTPTQHAYIHFCNSAVNASAAPSFEDSSDVGNTNVSASFSPVNRVYSIPSEKRGVTWNRVRFYLGSGVTLSGTFSPMVCYENTASSYEPYVAPTTYTASLGRTIYGGTADIVNGTGTETWKDIKISDLSFVKVTDCQHTFRCQNLPRKYGWQLYNILSNVFSTYTSGHSTGSNISSLEVGNDNTIFINSGSGTFYITTDSTFDDKAVADFLTAYGNTILIYELATPTDFTFTGQEVNTRLGYNAFWSDSGDTELTYYKDGYGFTSVTIHKETPEGEPVEQTAKFHKIVYGGTADVVKGTCEPKNLFDDSTFPRTSTDNTYYAQFQSNLAEGNKYKIPTIHIEPDVAYVLSFDVECNTEPFNASVGIGIGFYSKDIASVYNNTSGRISVPFTLTSALKEQYGDILSFRVPRYSTPREFTFTISNVQLEKASSASEYAPHFDPFIFPPISMETDDGENNLFANEGDSSITYRKAVD